MIDMHNMEKQITNTGPAYKAEDTNLNNFRLGRRLKIKSGKIENCYSVLQKSEEYKGKIYSEKQKETFSKAVKIK